MTDFVVTMRDWRRMCKMYTVDEHECEGCPLEHITEHACGAIFEPEFADVVDWATLEKFVDEWAAGHPVKVYPTWWKYLCMIGLIPDSLGDKTLGEVTIKQLMNTEVPADIAQKLGIEPVNIVHGNTAPTRADEACKRLGLVVDGKGV